MGQLRTVSLSERDDQDKHKRGSRDDGRKHGGTQIVRKHGVRRIFFADTDRDFDAGFVVRDAVAVKRTDIVSASVDAVRRGNEVPVSVFTVFRQFRNGAGHRPAIAEIAENGEKIVNRKAEQDGKGNGKRKIDICVIIGIKLFLIFIQKE